MSELLYQTDNIDEIRAYIALIRNRTTNTIEQWNLMIDAERKLEGNDDGKN